MSDFPCAVIADGYSRRGFVKARNHCYPAVKFRYRPVPLADYNTISNAVRDAKTGQAEAHVVVKTIGKYVETWNTVDDKGEPVELRTNGKPNVDGLLKLDAYLLSRVYQITMGNFDTDEDPEWPQTETGNGREFDALMGIVGGEADDLGNSQGE